MPPNPPNNAHGFAMRSMSLRDMQTLKSEKKILGPSLPNPGDANMKNNLRNIEIGSIRLLFDKHHFDQLDFKYDINILSDMYVKQETSEFFIGYDE